MKKKKRQILLRTPLVSTLIENRPSKASSLRRTDSIVSTIIDNELSKESSLRRKDSMDFREDNIDKQCSIQAINTDDQIAR